MKNFTGIITVITFFFPFLAFPQTYTPTGIDDPVISITEVVTPATHCKPANGAIIATATIEGNPLSANSEFQWFVGTQSAPADAFQEGVDGNIEVGENSTSRIYNIKPGAYTLIVSDGEAISGPQTFIVENQTTIPKILDVAVIHQNCSVPGSVEVTGISPGDPDDYAYTWYEGAVNEENTIQEITGPALLYEDAGTYYVVATLKGSGCVSDTMQAIIEDQSTEPVINFTQTADTSCKQNNGVLEATVSPFGSYSFSWFTGSGTENPIEVAATGIENKSRIENLAAGIYTVVATSNESGCQVTGSAEVASQTPEAPTLSVSVSPKDLCSPSGSIEIAGVSQGDLSGYTYAWYKDSPQAVNLIPGVSGPVLNALNYTGIGAGIYYVVATSQESGCASSPLEAVIEDISANPDIVLTGQADAITAEVSGEGVFTFEWFLGEDTPFQEGTHGNITGDENNSRIENIIPGVYTVTVTNDFSGCKATKSYTLQGESVKPQVTGITSGADDPTSQSPVTVQVTFSEPMHDRFNLSMVVIENGSAGNLKRVNENTFSFEVTPVSDGQVTVEIPAGIAYDMANNPNEAAGEIFRIAFDRTAPTVTIKAGIAGTTDISPVPLTIEFSEAVTGFSLEDIAATNSVLSGFTQVNEAEYKVSLEPLAPGGVTVFVAGGSVRDAAGNPNVEGTLQFAFQTADTTTVAFVTPASLTIRRSEGSFALEVILTNPDPLQPTSVEVALTDGDPEAIENYTARTLTFAAGSEEPQLVSVNISEDDSAEEEKTFVFSLQNVSGGYKATTQEPSTFQVIIQYDGVTGLSPGIISGVDIFPNPVAGYLQVNLDESMTGEPSRVTIYDLYGRKVKAQQLSSDNNRISVNALKNGIYMVYFQHKDRLMVQRIQVLK